MATAFSWTCPYCNRNATITINNTSSETHRFNQFNKDGDLILTSMVVVCPHPECREYTIAAGLHKATYNGSSWRLTEPSIMDWRLKPKSSSKPFPAYIPKAILDDYYEACIIVNDSPKASATLSRRCLQGIIRGFWGVSKGSLKDEIDTLDGKIDKTSWEAIDAVRSIGNIGAHMERDINLIVDVEPEEASLLIGLIEFLLEDWYVARHDREEHKKKVIALATAKAAAKKAPLPTP